MDETRDRDMVNIAEMLPMDEFTKFCQRWNIQELAVFGSALRADFNPESDIDIIVTFDDDADWSRKEILSTASVIFPDRKVIYATG